MSNEYLKHYGVKGMKWGVRKGTIKNTVSSGRKKIASKYDAYKNSDNYKARASRKKELKKMRTMSDADLKKKIERLKMEKQLKDLVEEDISPGKKFAREVMSSAGKKVLTAAVAGAAAYAGHAYLKKKFGDMPANYVFPKPKFK